MKNIILKISVFVFALTFIGCDSDNTTVEDVYDKTVNGAWLRTVKINSSSFNLFDTSSSFSVTIEAQDNERGKLLSQVNTFVTFKDNTDDGVDNSKTEVALGTVPAANFTESQFNLPTTTITVTLNEVLSSLGLTQNQYNGGDVFSIRLEIVLTDGRTYSSSNVNGNVAALGGFYSSPYIYSAALVCPTNLEGTHSYVSTNFSAITGTCPTTSVTGTVTWTNLGGGKYETSDLGFGQYQSTCWGDSPAFKSGASTFVDACNQITSGGTDQYGLIYTWTITKVEGTQLFMSWVNDYDDSGDVILTREGNIDWPPLTTN